MNFFAVKSKKACGMLLFETVLEINIYSIQHDALPALVIAGAYAGFIPVALLPLQAVAGGSQSGNVGEQTDGGTGNWRGMLKKGEDGPAGDRAVLQHPLPASPHRGHAVNLLDVVGALHLWTL